ncbi:hypothetical protein LHJ74_08020 [Streptomyces sp. N2-109]|uniref:Uncharacterized protein n=1 Tax=Streptomyces gossypii TaxID=2883101 RepID=A0ABT2JPR0_9ACTN|nr:hypothetical protein [Streptomyces gossypii]MCT2589859.1 hypothetical protein [Streptomyces gossypii]
MVQPALLEDRQCTACSGEGRGFASSRDAASSATSLASSLLSDCASTVRQPWQAAKAKNGRVSRASTRRDR